MKNPVVIWGAAALLGGTSIATLPLAAMEIVVPSPATRELTQGVQEITAPGIPGVVVAFGEKAFPVIVGKNGKAQSPVVAAAQAGNGRIVAFGHDGYFASENIQKNDTTTLFLNAIRWAGNGKTSVGVFKNDALVKWLQAQNVKPKSVQLNALEGVDVLISDARDWNDSHLLALRSHLARGGGIITAATGWGWTQLNADKNIAQDFAGNKLLAPFGLVWTNGMLDRTSQNGFTSATPHPLTHGKAALDAITALLSSGKALPVEDAAQAGATLSALAQGLPADDTVLMPRLRALAGGLTGDVVPMGRRPIRAEDASARLLLTLQTVIGKTLPIDEVKAHPAGAIFPGDVPPNVKPIAQTLEINTKIPDWHSTGLYAAPGAKIKVTLPAGAEKSGLGVRIGCHTDSLWHLDKWERAPEISRAWPLKAAETTVANPFGGLVYITAPRNSSASTIQVKVEGAHEAPRYVLGKTDINDWKNRIRWLPGPWAEIESDRVIVSVPSRSVRDMENPHEVAQLYADALDAIADLSTISRQRTRPERIVCDQQISAGYMHSGYPVMTFLDVEKNSVDAEALRKNSWGHWHEFGHNHQVGDWTFSGTGEVTCNLFALYVWEKVIGKERPLAHPALRQGQFEKMWAKYAAEGKQYEKLKGDPFLFLNMYIQLQDAFGWDTFKMVFAEYRNLKDGERPKTDDEKRDQWMVRFSRAAGKNLGPFFQAWNVPTSGKARDSIKDLPIWMPNGFTG